MAVRSLSMFIPSLSPTNSSSHRSSSAVKHFLRVTCSAQTEEPSRNQPSSSSPGSKNWRNGGFDGFGSRSPHIWMFIANQCRGNEARSCHWFSGATRFFRAQENIYEKDHWANLDASSGSLEVTASSNTEHALFDAIILQRSNDAAQVAVDLISGLVIMGLDPAKAKLAAGILGPSRSAFGFLFIVRIVMSWYPRLPVGEFPYVLAYAPTEPFLVVTRKVIPPFGGVDVTPVVWFGIISFLNEILVGPQGLLILLSQQIG